MGELRKTYGKEFTNIHERDVFNFLYSDTKNAYASRDDFFNMVEGRISRGKERLFPECDENGCTKIRDFREVGENKREYQRLDQLTKEKKELQERFRTQRTATRVYTDEEKEALRLVLQQQQDKIDKLKKDLGVKEDAKGLF